MRAGVRLALPTMAYCTDNAAMIAAAGRHTLLSDLELSSVLDIQPSLQLTPRRIPLSRKETTHS
jgi:N6-L-threonylcarbamoyladenine synthase